MLQQSFEISVYNEGGGGGGCDAGYPLKEIEQALEAKATLC